ncbi:hypothetical protein LJ656_22120 [Paraburkholderia sp. MMS20-SJTR3]|uniref:Uncharacterized protein n=1 Tax=Paraburkholderia sejongensis TaxID=2886946 RepID=A0ABS8JZF0_9BURK|nr:hypothetical protein [Paraburkholderia sp. MMS20-SJTR3]MCC8395288.1 hypothetical protein [Paraburkholderia sp. MMS20-SJTR3]
MSDLEADTSAALRSFAENWLKRALTPDELAELERFRRAWRDGERAPAAQPAADPAAKVREQAAQAVSDAKQRSDSAIREVLQKLQGTAAQALQAYENEERAILKVVEAARSLNDLRPSSLNPAANAASPGVQMVLPQIADRLANLIKSEVDQCFERHFGPLQRQLAALLNQHASGGPAGSGPPAGGTVAARATAAPLPPTAPRAAAPAGAAGAPDTLAAQGTAPPVMR